MKKNSGSKRPLPKGAVLHSKAGKLVFRGVRYEVYQWKQKLFDGKEAVFETVKRNDSVMVLPIIDDKIVVLKEKQPHIKKEFLGLVAGGIEEGEDLETAARRELLEETGMTFKNMYLVYVDQYVSGIEWFGYMFIATGLIKRGKKQLDGGEQNKVLKMGFEEVVSAVRKKVFLHRPRMIIDFLIEGKEKELKDIIENPEKYVIEIGQ